MWFCDVWPCACALVDTYVCMCLRIDSLRVNGTRDRDGKNSSSVGKRWLEIKRKSSEWVGGVDVWSVNHEGVRGSAWPLLTLHTHLHDAKSLWGPLLASIIFLFGQHQKILRTHEGFLQTKAQISQLGSTAPSELQIMSMIARRDLILFWCFESFLLQ